MLSLVRLKAGGMHMQVRMTKDNQVILFGDDDLNVSGIFFFMGYFFMVKAITI